MNFMTFIRNFCIWQQKQMCQRRVGRKSSICLQIEHPERNENHNEVEEIIRDPAKRAGLREVSTLSIQRIEPKELNLHSLLGRESESFTITTKIVQNGYQLPSTPWLILEQMGLYLLMPIKLLILF